MLHIFKDTEACSHKEAYCLHAHFKHFLECLHAMPFQHSVITPDMHGVRFTKATRYVPLKMIKFVPRTALKFQQWLVSKQLNMEGLATDLRFTCLLMYALCVFGHVLWIFCIMLHLHVFINEHQSEYLKTSVVASTFENILTEWRHAVKMI